MNYIAYTDGSCDPHTGKGAWAAILIDADSPDLEVVATLVGTESFTTSVRMEIQAAIEALRHINIEHGVGCKIEIRSDATYVVQGGTKWLNDWRKQGKLKAGALNAPKGTQPKNLDLWLAVDHLIVGHDVKWTWVKSHSSNPFNVECDRLATEARLGVSMIRVSLSTRTPPVHHEPGAARLEATIKAVRDEAPWMTITAATRIAKSVILALQKDLRE